MTEKLPIECQFTNYSNIYLSFWQRSQKVNDSRMGEFLLLTMKQLVDLSACIYIEIERKKKEKREKNGFDLGSPGS